MPPLLNPGRILSSPFLVDNFTVQRRQEIVNNFGRSIQFVVQFNTVPGIVKPEGNNDLEREADYQIQPKTILVTTNFALRPASTDPSTGNGYQPDLVVWHGDSYVVKRLRDNLHFGIGFTKAECTNEGVIPTSPEKVAAVLPVGAQLYTPTILSPTQASLPINLNSPRLVWFRDGVLITAQNGDYTQSTTITSVIITLKIPLGQEETIFAYA